jgi:cellulose synthase/poly-beta-1,6-N-acetylglucosamine synthase-like glycosyltransferase
MSVGEAIEIGVLLLSAGALFYIYCGYGWLLAVLKRMGLAEPLAAPDTAPPSVTVLVTVHNEEREIAARLADLLAQDYPDDKLEILVATDGTTDRTHAIVEGIVQSAPAVRLLPSQERLGKSAAQNRAVPQARGEIVVLTDAATRFEPSFVAEIVRPFADPRVGCTTGLLKLVDKPGAVARGQGYYWRYEMKLRGLESDLGLLAVTSGQAMAFRRKLFQPIPPHVGDDCIIPLDIVLAGHRVVHRPQAVAYDTFEHDLGRETRSRIRMTMRNLAGTWLRPALLDPLRAPGYALALWSHKLLRWLGSVFLLTFLISAAALAFSPRFRVVSLAVGGVCLLAPVGWYSHRHDRDWGLAETVFSFFLANAAFLIGTARAMLGGRIVAYRSGKLGN